jgi:hypothetical protein
MRLIRAVLYWDECRIETVVEDNDGHRRLIGTNCYAKDRKDIPPKTWVEGVRGEVEFQRTREFNEGKYVPGSSPFPVK